jgi:hypothetical protein
MGVRINWHVDGDLVQERALAVEHLDATVATVRHVNVPLRVHRNAMRSVELSGTLAGLAPRLEPIAVFIDLSYARVDIAVATNRLLSLEWQHSGRVRDNLQKYYGLKP